MIKRRLIMLSDYPVAAALPASDIARARKFYEETLGLKPEPSGSGDEATYRCANGTAIFVYASPYAGTNRATAAGWQVPDLRSVVKSLKEMGVEFEDYDMPGLKTEDGIAMLPDGTMSAWFTDTEGNILAVDQMPD